MRVPLWCLRSAVCGDLRPVMMPLWRMEIDASSAPFSSFTCGVAAGGGCRKGGGGSNGGWRGFEPVMACNACVAWNAAVEMQACEAWRLHWLVSPPPGVDGAAWTELAARRHEAATMIQKWHRGWKTRTLATAAVSGIVS